MTFGEKVINFYQKLQVPQNLPEGVETLFPFESDLVTQIVENFNRKYFHDSNPRTFLIGINPGRLGGGVTGIPFTDPIRLEEVLGIENDLDKKQELSSNFIYQMIEHLGGAEKFYANFYFTSVSPVGFTMEGKNLNYYDIKELQDCLEEYIVSTLKEQIQFGTKPIAYSLGKGKNIAYLKELNKKYSLFERIEALPHPRWVMQYRLKNLPEILDQFKSTLLS